MNLLRARINFLFPFFLFPFISLIFFPLPLTLCSFLPSIFSSFYYGGLYESMMGTQLQSQWVFSDNLESKTHCLHCILFLFIPPKGPCIISWWLIWYLLTSPDFFHVFEKLILWLEYHLIELGLFDFLIFDMEGLLNLMNTKGYYYRIGLSWWLKW